MIKPKNQQVLVRPFPSDEETVGGIYVPESCRERNNKATVVAAGSGTEKHPMQYKVGMVVHNIKDCGEPFVICGEILYLMDQSSILAIEN